MSCNTCQCGERNALLCTKMACFEHVIMRAKYQKEYLRQSKRSQEKSKKKNNKKKPDYPPLPATGECEPGKIYRKRCKKCFCNEKKLPVCTPSCSSAFPGRFTDKEISQMESRSALDLPELPHMGHKCEPGRSYLVECNVCFCSQKHDLTCTKMYCLKIETYADEHAKELSGRKCKGGSNFQMLCSQCECINNVTRCKPMQNCKKMSGKKLLASARGTKVKLAINIQKDKCKPNVAYKHHCNECYCQLDGSLRCTQKICLTYSQAEDLKVKETFLMRHGL